MERKYAPEDFPYPLDEDMSVAYAAKEALTLDPTNSKKYWTLKDAVYQVKLTLKSLGITGHVDPIQRDEIEDYFWGFLL